MKKHVAAGTNLVAPIVVHTTIDVVVDVAAVVVLPRNRTPPIHRVNQATMVLLAVAMMHATPATTAVVADVIDLVAVIDPQRVVGRVAERRTAINRLPMQTKAIVAETNVV